VFTFPLVVRIIELDVPEPIGQMEASCEESIKLIF